MNLLKSGVTHALCTKIFLKKQGAYPPGGAEPICSSEDISVRSLIKSPPNWVAIFICSLSSVSLRLMVFCVVLKYEKALRAVVEEKLRLFGSVGKA